MDNMRLTVYVINGNIITICIAFANPSCVFINSTYDDSECYMNSAIYVILFYTTIGGRIR